MTRIGSVSVALLVIAAPVHSAGAAEDHATHAPPGLVLSQITGALPKTPTATVRIFESSFAPGYASPWHIHPSPPFIYVVSGHPTWEYKDGRRPATRHPGEGMMEPPNVEMRLLNRTKAPMRLVLFQVSKPNEPVMRVVRP